MPLIYPLQSQTQASHAEVGGKGHSLLRMLDAGLAVPGGFVLSVEFFSPWLKQLQERAEWESFLQAQPSELQAACDTLKTISQELTLTTTQQEALDEALAGFPSDALFAVRSSSPEEDLEGSSFAGAYETVLGVNTSTLEAAIHTAFASCLDVRIAVYKKERGFPINNPKIAVVVQSQIASEIAGVGFSINPLNNHHDEAVFNANWGLGETVVAGLASPDLYVVNKHTMHIQERTLGGKETSIWLKPDGGTEEKRDPRYDEHSLTDAQLLALTEQLQRIEAYYEKPMDIEWAFEGEKLYLLQARPITTHLPLTSDMMTPPGEPKRLYFDITIAVQGILEPLSPLGADVFRLLKSIVRKEFLGVHTQRPIDEVIVIVRNGRVYANFCNVLKLRGQEKLASMLSNMDGLASQSVAQLDLSSFDPGHISKPKLILGALSRIFPRLVRFWRAVRNPQRAKARWDEQWNKLKENLRALQEKSLPLEQHIEEIIQRTARFILRDTMVLYPSARLAYSKIHKLFEKDASEEIEKHLEALEQSLPGNVTFEMGMALYELHHHLPSEKAQDPETLEQAIQERDLPDNFLKGWDAFLTQYGHRSPKEIDVATPRFREQPRVLLQQLVGFVQSEDKSHSTPALFEQGRQRRIEAHQFLSQHLASSPRKLAKFQKLYKRLETLGGQRETHKFVAVFGFDQVRQRFLKEAQALVDAQRLESIEDFFFLSYFELLRALQDKNLALAPLVQNGRSKYAQANQCKQIFPIMDSRGCFHRPPPPEAKPGEIVGQGVSPGKIQGRVKVLHHPDEKPLHKGEILVARATDPGWTPLFANAAGIILEIGGPLQHGALVAREYGIPCVSGVQNATESFEDGQLVEVDGSAGIVRQEQLLNDSSN